MVSGSKQEARNGYCGSGDCHEKPRNFHTASCKSVRISSTAHSKSAFVAKCGRVASTLAVRSSMDVAIFMSPNCDLYLQVHPKNSFG